MWSLLLGVTTLTASVTVTVGYKIRRSECFMAESRDVEESTVMHCTCGGIGDPYSIIMNKVRAGGRDFLALTGTIGIIICVRPWSSLFFMSLYQEKL